MARPRLSCARRSACNRQALVTVQRGRRICATSSCRSATEVCEGVTRGAALETTVVEFHQAGLVVAAAAPGRSRGRGVVGGGITVAEKPYEIAARGLNVLGDRTAELLDNAIAGLDDVA